MKKPISVNSGQFVWSGFKLCQNHISEFITKWTKPRLLKNIIFARQGLWSIFKSKKRFKTFWNWTQQSGLVLWDNLYGTQFSIWADDWRFRSYMACEIVSLHTNISSLDSKEIGTAIDYITKLIDWNSRFNDLNTDVETRLQFNS